MQEFWAMISSSVSYILSVRYAQKYIYILYSERKTVSSDSGKKNGTQAKKTVFRRKSRKEIGKEKAFTKNCWKTVVFKSYPHYPPTFPPNVMQAPFTIPKNRDIRRMRKNNYKKGKSAEISLHINNFRKMPCAESMKLFADSKKYTNLSKRKNNFINL